MLCLLTLYISGGTYSLKSILNDRFLRNFSWQFQFISLSEIAEDIFFFLYFVSMPYLLYELALYV